MTEVVYLHVGGPKSGTTFIQQVLEHNSAALARSGVLVVGPRLELIHAAMAVRGDDRLGDLPAAARDAWDRVTEQVREWQGTSAILSYELFANASAEQVRTALARLEARVCLEELVARVADYDVDPDGIERVHSINVRGFATLPTTVRAR